MSRRITKEEISQRVNNAYNGEFEIVGEIGLQNEVTTLLHKKCGNTFLKRPLKIFREEEYCPYCSKGGIKNKTTKDINDALNEKFNGEFILIGDYNGYHKNNKILHTKCNREFETSVASLMRRGNCKDCKMEETLKNKTKTTQQFKEEVYSLFKDEYEVCGEYLGSKTKIQLRHNKCDSTFNIIPNSFLTGHHCPHCVKFELSKYAKIVKKFLEENNFEYIMEKKFEQCKHKSHLPFDFYIPSLNCCIEVDGESHFHIGCFGGSEEDFNMIKHRDEIKTNFCKNNGIRLIRLPYFKEKDFVKILKANLYDNTEVTTESKISVAL